MNWLRTGWMILFAAVCANSADASVRSRYRIYFTDKAKTEYALSAPEKYLSDRAIARRQKQNIAIDSTDLPVCRVYVESLKEAGTKCILTSKWHNSVLVECQNEADAAKLRTFPFVKKMEKVWISLDVAEEEVSDRKKMVTNELPKSKDYYGMAAAQIAMHKGDSLHQMGYKGMGMQIAVIDAGFFNADRMKALKKMKLLGVHDFVGTGTDIFAEHEHGMKVLSCMAANAPRSMVGTAPEASYLLLRSEDDLTEQPAEEDAWAAAVEYADSVGVDVVNTSLGYYHFDNPFRNYRYNELNGKTSMMSISASMMAQKGMLLVCSAGNTGDGSWKKITTPADATDVLAVGAIGKDSVNAVFSAIGNTADGRIKPDVMAMGFEAAVLEVDGSVATANGTSFSAPIFCGLAACLWQACPWLNVYELIDVIRRSGDSYSSPNNVFGYGIVDMMKAYRKGMELKR